VYWLLKSEPDVYSIDELARTRRGPWEGVRNYQARNHLRAMKKGELGFFYHSSCEPPGIAGLLRIHREAYADATQFDPRSEYHDPKSKPSDPRWSMVDVEFVEKFRELIPLQRLKEDRALAGMLVAQRGQRLSVQPVERDHFEHILGLASAKTRLR
jgi:predicted RNA-binding protein with PUA-like domain